MRPIPQRLSHPSRSILYGLAVGLPILSAILTAKIHALHAVPFALAFISVAVVATLGGLSPALVGLASTFLSHEAAIYWVTRRWPVTLLDLLRMVILLAMALVLSFMTQRRNRVAARLQQTLAALEDRTFELVESQQASRCISWRYDVKSGVSWHPGGYEVFGIPFQQLNSLPSPVSYIHPDDKPRVLAAGRSMISESALLHIEFRVLWPNGEVHWLEARGSALPGARGVWRGIIFDITERKLAETALIQAEKLAAMGRLASTVAHEINNPLEAVTNLLYLLRADKSLNPETRAYLETAERELSRLADITRLTLGFVRSNAPPATVELAAVLEDVLSIFRHRYGMKNIRIERNFEPGVAIYIAPHELRQIITNLISNAIDALSLPGSILSLRIFTEHDRATILFEDNGSGIDPVALSRIFEPFFTTKDEIGTGIGLWVTRELVEKNGGRINAYSGDLDNSMKTQFRLEFPVAVASMHPVSS